MRAARCSRRSELILIDDDAYVRIAECNRSSIAGATAAAIPIWFVTAATYKDVRGRLIAAARAFADAAGFEPKPGHYLALPGEGGLSGILFGLENGGRREGSVSARPACRSNCPPASIVSPTIRTTPGLRHWPSRSALIALRATTSPKPQDQARSAAKPRPRRSRARSRSGHAGARPRQHAGERHGPGRSRRGGARACRQARRQRQSDDRRRSAAGEFSAHSCRRPCRRASAAADRSELGRGRTIRA